MEAGMKKILPILIAALTLAGCRNTRGAEPNENAVEGKTFVYEKEGFGGNFTISFMDGEFWYYEGMLSSYIGHGRFKIDGNVLTMVDGDDISMDRSGGFTNRFLIDGKRLVWQENGSTNFLYMKISDGDCFLETERKQEWYIPRNGK